MYIELAGYCKFVHGTPFIQNLLPVVFAGEYLWLHQHIILQLSKSKYARVQAISSP